AFTRAFRSKSAPFVPEPIARRPAAPLPVVIPASGWHVERARLAALVRLYFRTIVRDRAFLAIAAIGALMTVVNAFYADLMYGTTVYPVTYAMIEVIGGFALFFLILSALYAGELVWRERHNKCDQLVDATPTATGLVFASKLGALLLVHATLFGALILTGVIVQALKGYYLFELDVYIGFLYGITLPAVVLITVLSFFIHV